MSKEARIFFRKRAKYTIYLVPYFCSETGLEVEFANKDDTTCETRQLVQDSTDALKKREETVFLHDLKPSKAKKDFENFKVRLEIFRKKYLSDGSAKEEDQKR